MYGLFGPKSWKAVQAFAVRDEMIGQHNPGRFESLDAMKTAQETISKVATSSTVVRNTLDQLGKDTSLASIEDLQDAISFSAPNGAEFGKTEILLMAVKNKSPERAKETVSVLFDQLEKELRRLRKIRAQSMQRELQLANELTKSEWERVAAKLNKIVSRVGSDLADLRSLNDPNSSPGNLTRQLDQIRSELRPARIKLRTLNEQKSNLSHVVGNAEEILATPSELLELQPALHRLKDGLVDAQLRLATVLGKYKTRHPNAIAAQRAVNDTKTRIRHELTLAIKGLESQIAIADNRVSNLLQREKEITVRLGEPSRLASRVRKTVGRIPTTP